MGDLAVVLGVVVGAAASLRRPWIGAVLSVLISLMSPHIMFGWRVRDWPVAQVVALATLVGWLMTRDRENPLASSPARWLVAFWIWICITLPFSFYFSQSLPLWERSMKIFLLVFIALALVNNRQRLEWLIYAIVLALGFYGVKGGIFTLVTGGNYRVWGPGGFVEGNNELALALVALLPLVRYVHLHGPNKWARLAALGTLLILPITILGSHSRGALLGLGAMSFFLWLKSRKKFFGAIIFVSIGALALSFMPEHWWARMETIQTYQSDDSALGRINAWWAAWNIASANFFGGGFMVYMPDVWQRYAPNPNSLNAAHSIYFQVLGEHGFVGLFLFVFIGVSTWRTCTKLIKSARSDPDLRWAGDLAAMIQVSLIGFAAGGAFLSLAYFDLPYYLMAIAVIAERVAARRDGTGSSTNLSDREVVRPPSTLARGTAIALPSSRMSR